MSDTPRTDAAVREVDVAFVGHWGLSSEPQEFVSPEFTRELERENAELRADKERLDFLQRVAEEGGFQCFGIEDSALLDFEFSNRENETSDSVRAAIDAARKEGQP